MSSTPHVSHVTSDGAAWLASAGPYPRSTLALWEERPDAPVVLPCGSSFDVVSASAIFGRRMLDRMWADGPGSGPVAESRGRILLFAAPGTAQRLPSLLEWEEWGGRTGTVPSLLCHGTGDAVTVPAVTASPGAPARPPDPVPLPAGWWPPTPATPGCPARGAAVGGRPGGPRGRADFDFSSRRPGC